MRVLVPDMHAIIPISFANAYKALGITMVMCDNTFPITYGKKWDKESVKVLGDNVECVSWSEFIENPTDVVSIMCYEHQQDVITKVMPNANWKPRLLYYSGNDDMYKFYAPQYVKNILAVDDSTYNHFSTKDVNCVQYFPWIDYSKFGPPTLSNDRIINCYTSNLERLFPESYKLSKDVVESVDAEFNYYGSDTKYLERNDLVKEITRSSLTNVIKRIEGYGYNIIESMALGRPCIHYRPFTINRTFSKWLTDDTGIIFNDVSDYQAKATKYFEDDEFRHGMQIKASNAIKKMIDNEEQNGILKKVYGEFKMTDFGEEYIAGGKKSSPIGGIDYTNKQKDDYNWQTYYQPYGQQQSQMKNQYTQTLDNNFLIEDGKIVLNEGLLDLHENWRLLYEKVLKLKATSVVEFGCGWGDHLNNIKKSANIKVNGLDIGSGQLDNLKKRYPHLSDDVRLFDITVDDFDDSIKADIAYSQAVIMHINTDDLHKKALRNMLKTANNQLVLVENWNNHNYMDDILEINEKEKLWDDMYFYYEKLEASRIMVVSKYKIEDEIPLNNYAEIK